MNRHQRYRRWRDGQKAYVAGESESIPTAAEVARWRDRSEVTDTEYFVALGRVAACRRLGRLA